ncbi:MAG: DUF6812 domain-containing protein [Candidatus Limnocylindrales bacterium]
MYDDVPGGSLDLTLYTDSFIIRGTISTRYRRVTDVLNDPEHHFIVLSEATVDEYGSRELATRSQYAQVNLATVLFAVSSVPVDSLPELRTIKVPEAALISIPPFRISGRIHLLPDRSLVQALGELEARFLPVTDATFWSETVGEARQAVALLAFNQARAQVLAPFRIVDPWADLTP